MSPRALDVGFIVHDAGRTGAPIVLLRVVRELVRTGVVKPRFLIARGGELVGEFRALGPVLVLAEPRSLGGRLGRPGERIDAIVRYPQRIAIGRFLNGIDVLYSNTVVNGDVLGQIGLAGVPLVTHVHELQRFLDLWTTPRALQRTVERTRAWISVSDAVSRMLVDDWHIPPAGVLLVRECIDRDVLDHEADRSGGNALLQVADGDWVIGCVGTIDQRKGADLFALLARLMLQRPTSRPLAFRWIGGRLGTPEHQAAEAETRRMGLADELRFLGDVTAPMDAFARFDAHVLLSREDPYPLVMLEAAALGCPTVCFEGSGGAPEFVGRGAGRVVGYLDLGSMANAIFDLLLTGDGESRARCRALAAEHDAASAADQIGDILRQVAR